MFCVHMESSVFGSLFEVGESVSKAIIAPEKPQLQSGTVGLILSVPHVTSAKERGKAVSHG